MWHLRDLAAGKKKLIKGTDVKHLNIPQYEHLTIEDFLKFADDYPFVMMYFPSRKVELEKLPRQYIINIIYTKLGEKFRSWVQERVNNRHEKIKDEGDMYIELDPQIAEIYKTCKAVSTTNGKSYQMMKVGAKPRRTKAEIQEEKLRKAAEEKEIEQKLKEHAEM